MRDELKPTLAPCPWCGKVPEMIPSGMRDEGLMIHCLTPGCVNPHVSYIPPSAAIAAWNRRSPVEAWQPIETAPTDRNVLVCAPSWLDGPDVGRVDTHGLWYSPIDGSGFEPEPTHWCPLPDPPALTQQTQSTKENEG